MYSCVKKKEVFLRLFIGMYMFTQQEVCNYMYWVLLSANIYWLLNECILFISADPQITVKCYL